MLDCRVLNAMDGGDLSCFLAEVVDGDTQGVGEPLFARDARNLAAEDFNQEWDRRLQHNIEISERTMDQMSYSPWKP